MKTFLPYLCALGLLAATGPARAMVGPGVEFYQSVFLCAGDTLTVGPVKLAQAGNFTTLLTAASGCDSTVYTYIELLPRYEQYVIQTLCPDELFRGVRYLRDTVLVDSLLTRAGCDSLFVYELDVAAPPVIGISGDTLSCADTYTPLDAPGGYAAYRWSTGATTRSVEVGPGAYTVQVTNSAGCTFELSHTIAAATPLNEIDWTGPTCPGTADGRLEILLTTGGTPPYRYELPGVRPASDTPVFDNLPAGDYTLLVSDARGCEERIDFTLTAQSPLDVQLTGLPTGPVERGDTIALQLTTDPTDVDIRWTAEGGLSCFYCPAPLWTVGGEGRIGYTVTTELGCVRTESFQLETLDPQRLYFPNAFSPNDDGRNDTYRIGFGPNVVAVLDWSIYNRWGSQLLRVRNKDPDHPDLQWDGRTRGSPAPPGVYVYRASVAFANGSTRTYGGEIHLLK